MTLSLRKKQTRKAIIHEEMFSCLSDGEKAELLSLLEKVNADWEMRYRGTEEACR